MTPSLTVRPAFASWMHWHRELLLPFGAAGLAIIRWPLAGVLIFVTYGALVFALLRRAEVVLTPAGVTVRGITRSTSVRWSDVRAVTFGPLNTGISRRGYGLTLSTKHPLPTRMLELVLTASSRRLITAFMAEQVPQVPVDPTPPWRDRFGEWHIEPRGYDPAETIRSVRTASIGPWVINVRSCPGGFRAGVSDVRTGAVIEAGETRSSLRDAIDDGSALVREYQQRLPTISA